VSLSPSSVSLNDFFLESSVSLNVAREMEYWAEKKAPPRTELLISCRSGFVTFSPEPLKSSPLLFFLAGKAFSILVVSFR
jgi:hypothetical protein